MDIQLSVRWVVLGFVAICLSHVSHFGFESAATNQLTLTAPIVDFYGHRLTFLAGWFRFVKEGKRGPFLWEIVVCEDG